MILIATYKAYLLNSASLYLGVIIFSSTISITTGDALSRPSSTSFLVSVIFEVVLFLFSPVLRLLLLLPPQWRIWFVDWFILVSSLETTPSDWTFSSHRNVPTVVDQYPYYLRAMYLELSYLITSLQVNLDNLVVFSPLLIISRRTDVYWPVVENISNRFIVNWFTIIRPNW